MMTENTDTERTPVVFRRYEMKYMITRRQFARLLPVIMKYMKEDEFGRYKICNIYLDTKEYSLVRTSLEKPLYKEKLRLRSYGTPQPDSFVFLELKKKYDGIVYKRRVPMTLEEARMYLSRGIYPAERDGQNLRELDFAVSKYKPVPGAYLSYDRISLVGIDNPLLRMTFDHNITCRNTDMLLEHGSYGQKILDDDKLIMEVKIPDNMPLWLASLLSESRIFPTGYSKYGTYYTVCLAGEAPASQRHSESPAVDQEIAAVVEKGGVYCA